MPKTETEDGQRAAAVVHDELVDALVQTAFVTMAVLNKIGAENELSLTQLRVLTILSDRRLRMAELAGYLGLDRSTLTGLVDRAERRKLLVRAPNPSDGRAVDVFLSPTGAELADRLYTRVEHSLAPMTAGFSGPDRRRLRTLLEQLLAAR